MRIIAGERKGARLSAPRSRDVRPTADMVREALFQILGDVGGAEVLDPFAGSGALGLEALSRGAATADFCELSTAALRALRTNVERLGYADRCTIRRQDGRRRLAGDHAAGRAYDLLVIDPPYTMLAVLQDDLCQHAAALLRSGGRIAIEGAASAPPAPLPLEPVAARTYGQTAIAVYRRV